MVRGGSVCVCVCVCALANLMAVYRSPRDGKIAMGRTALSHKVCPPLPLTVNPLRPTGPLRTAFQLLRGKHPRLPHHPHFRLRTPDCQRLLQVRDAA